MSTLVKSTAFPSLRSMMEDFWNTDRLFVPPFFNTEKLPAVNIRDTKNGYELEVAAPGFNKDEFKVTTENGLLTVSAETSSEQNEEKNDYTRHEFSRAAFTRTFSLPENVEADHVKANYKDGLLTIELKKSGKALANRKVIKVS
jgi:HSP20 family protein